MYDLIVIGGGPAGYHAAEQAGKKGISTLLIEKKGLGGVCLNEGCIPAKTYLYSAKIKDGAQNAEKYGVTADNMRLDHEAVYTRKNNIVNMLISGVSAKLKNAGVKTVFGKAYITGKDGGITVQYDDKINGKQLAEGKKLLIATGSISKIPLIQGIDNALETGFAVTSREMFEIKYIPHRLAVIGGGVIGLEMANYFSSAGSEVTVIEILQNIGGDIDSDIARLLKKNLERKGIRFLLGNKVVKIEQNSLFAEDSSGIKEIRCDLILTAAGRQASITGLGIENIGIVTNNGAIVTDDQLRTNVLDVYAAGDVNGKSMLAHTAYREAETVVNNMVGYSDHMDYSAIPNAIFTNPEVAGVGETEQSARAKGIECVSKTVSMRFSGRYVAENEGGDGIAKIVLDNSSKIIGFHLIGNYATEVISAACIIVGLRMKPEQVKKCVFPHPTISEIIKESIFQVI